MRLYLFCGWQVPIITDNHYGNAKIESIATKKIKYNLSKKKIVVIAGFQGISKNGNITTLGRGGSDTTAVALAAYLKADRCDIFTDVDGVYNKDPNKEMGAIKYDFLTYDIMLDLANHGAKVLHNRCVEIGKKYRIPIYVKSSFIQNSKGTLIYY